MSYLITQTFILLLIAALLGLLLGWYLTKISAASARSALQARLRSAEADARGLRTELDAAIATRDNTEAQRRALSDELNNLRHDSDPGSADSNTLQVELAECREALTAAQARIADQESLQAQLDDCRSTLEGAAAGAEPSEHEVDSAAIASAAAAALSGAQGLVGASAAPAPLESTDTEPDDLQRIKGIGPKIAGILRDLGIQRFEQIAGWTPENIEWVNDHLKFKGRIEREEWIPQAKAFIDSRDKG